MPLASIRVFIHSSPFHRLDRFLLQKAPNFARQNLRDLSLVKAKPIKNYDNKSNVPKDFWVIKDGGFVAINKSYNLCRAKWLNTKLR